MHVNNDASSYVPEECADGRETSEEQLYEMCTLLIRTSSWRSVQARACMPRQKTCDCCYPEIGCNGMHTLQAAWCTASMGHQHCCFFTTEKLLTR